MNSHINTYGPRTKRQREYFRRDDSESETEEEEDYPDNTMGQSYGSRILLGMNRVHDLSSNNTQYICRDGARVSFFSKITRTTAGRLIQLLREASALIEAERKCGAVDFVDGCIELEISSEGGCAFSGLLIHDMVTMIPVDVRGIVCGRCCSAATLILLACTERCMLPHAFLMLHEISHGVSGSRLNVEREVTNTRLLSDKYRSIYLARSSMSADMLDSELSHDGILDAEAALSLGLIDRVIGPERARRRPRCAVQGLAQLTER